MGVTPRPDLLSRVKRTYELTPQLRNVRIQIAKLKKNAIKEAQSTQ